MNHAPDPSCECCANARTRYWAGFRFNCTGCVARMISRSPQFFASRHEGSLSAEYRSLIADYELTHEQVKAAHAADFESHDGEPT